MIEMTIYLGIGLITIGVLWGLGLAFDRSRVTGILTLLTSPKSVVFFLLFVRPNGFHRPTTLIGTGAALSIVAGFFQ